MVAMDLVLFGTNTADQRDRAGQIYSAASIGTAIEVCPSHTDISGEV